MKNRSLLFGATIALCFALLAVVSLRLAAATLAAWVVVSCALVLLAYGFNYAQIFRKDSDGSIPLALRWLFVPYLVGVTLYNRIKTAGDTVPPMQKITEQLYVGSRLIPNDLDGLGEANIGAVLDVTAEFDGLGSFAYEGEVNYLNIPILDHAIPTRAQLARALRWIRQQHEQNRTVLVHCALGRGRSVLVVAAYLIATGEANGPEDAITMVNTIRETARLNRRQRRRLRAWHKLGLLRAHARAVIIANPVAGGGKWQKAKADILEILSPHFDLDVHETDENSDVGAWVREAVKERVDIVIASGGDGTVTDVANALVGSKTPLGIIPMGTANALSHVLFGIQSKVLPVDTACQAIIERQFVRVDTAVANGQRLLLAAGIGIEADMISEADRSEKNKDGQLAYIRSFFSAVKQSRIHRFTLRIDDDAPFGVETPSLVIANAAPVTSVLARGHGEPRINDGQLDITWIREEAFRDQALASVSALALDALLGQSPSEEVEYRLARKIVIDADEPELLYSIDGEVTQGFPLTISIEPQSLTLCAPSLSQSQHHKHAA